MIPQIEGVLSLRKMFDHLNLKQVDGLRVETIIRLSRFVMQNNFFSYNDKFYHQIRGGAMRSGLTLTMANCFMYFFEQSILRQINNSNGLYFRYIDDIFIMTNWPERQLSKQIERWNQFDENIKLTATIGQSTNFLGLYVENENGKWITNVYHKPSHELYYLPFNSIHPLHMKKNISFGMLIRAIRYSSTFQFFIEEREALRVALLLNKYPNSFLEEQFRNVLDKFQVTEQMKHQNYLRLRQKIISQPETKSSTHDTEHMFVHFTYCSSMRSFPTKFKILWRKYFSKSPINDTTPVIGTRNIGNLQLRLA